eukprot:gene11175-12460_t
MNLFISPESDPSPAAYSTPSHSSASSSVRRQRPLSIAEKASPIQAITPDLRRGSLASSQPSTKSPTPFSSLQGFHRDGSEIAQLALAMESLFDDDADHPAAEISPLLDNKKNSQAVVFELSDEDSFEGFKSPERTRTEGVEEQEEEEMVSFGQEEDVPPSSSPPLPLATTLRSSATTFRSSATTFRSSATTETGSERRSFPHSSSLPPRFYPSVSPQTAALPGSSGGTTGYSDSDTYGYGDGDGDGDGDCEAWLESLSALSAEVSSSSLLSSVSDLRSQLQKLLLLPVERLQESVFRTHDQWVKEGLFEMREGVDA